MLKTTTPSVEGREIAAYLDIVVGEAILGSNFFKDMLGSIRDVVGGRSGAYEREMRKARETAFAEMEAYAQKLGADAVVGVDIDYEVIGQSGSMMMMVSVSGTAVKLKKCCLNNHLINMETPFESFQTAFFQSLFNF